MIDDSSSNTLKLLQLHSAGDDTTSIGNVLTLPLHSQSVEYDVVSWTVDNDHEEVDLADGSTIHAPTRVFEHLRNTAGTRNVFIQDVAVSRLDFGECTKVLKQLPEIHRRGRKVIIWGGTDDDDGCFVPFLGRGSPATTEAAFELARCLAEAETSSIAELLREKDPSSGLSKWSLLIRILFRDFWRGDLLLRSNYLESHPNVVVQVSSQTIPLGILQTAARRLRIAHPSPSYLLDANLSGHEAIETPEGWPSEKWYICKTDRDHLLASRRFGFDITVTMAHMYHLFRNAEEDLLQRFQVHLGMCEDIYYSRSRWESQKGLLRAVHGLLESGSDSCIAIEQEFDEPLRPLPTANFTGIRESPTPLPEHRAPFIHWRCCDDRNYIFVMEILPANDLHEPLQCGLREVNISEEKSLKYDVVINDYFLRLPLFQGERGAGDNEKGLNVPMPPIVTRSTTLILLNGHSYPVPKIQELFLRLMRSKEETTQLWLWNVCLYPDYLSITSRRDVSIYLRLKDRASSKARGKVDMYETLERSQEKYSLEELAGLGLPEGMGWDEWLLELAD